MNTKAQYPKMDFITPPGRLVAGDLATASDKGYNGAIRAKAQYFFALAVPKNSGPAHQQLGEIQNHVFQSYASMGQAGAGVVQRMQSFPIGSTTPGGAVAPFAWKFEDGDVPDNAGREGWAGCWIYKFTTTYPFGVVDAHNQQMDPAAIKLGWWAEVAAAVVINGQTDHTAGLHLNPRFVRIVGYDAVIVPGPSADQVFSAPPATLPPGVSATPIAQAQYAQMQQGFPTPQYGQMPQGFPAQVQPMPQASQPGPGTYTPPPAAAPQPGPGTYTPPMQQGFPVQAQPQGMPTPQYGAGALGASVPVPQGAVAAPTSHPGSTTASPSDQQPPAGVAPHPGFGGQQ